MSPGKSRYDACEISNSKFPIFGLPMRRHQMAKAVERDRILGFFFTYSLYAFENFFEAPKTAVAIILLFQAEGYLLVPFDDDIFSIIIDTLFDYGHREGDDVTFLFAREERRRKPFNFRKPLATIELVNPVA